MWISTCNVCSLRSALARTPHRSHSHPLWLL
jgi:hypothetical protein